MKSEKSQKIRTRPDRYENSEFKIGSWLFGKLTYLRFGNPDYLGTLSGQKLYRLAKSNCKKI